jgi:hypothetical protein
MQAGRLRYGIYLKRILKEFFIIPPKGGTPKSIFFCCGTGGALRPSLQGFEIAVCDIKVENSSEVN